MPVGEGDDTQASSMPILDGSAASIDVAELVGGRYRIVRWLGGGGMGRVYEAFDTELDERVALKVLRTGLTDEAIERFRREVKLTRRIQHRNVARMFDIGEHRGERYLTMELVDGETLTREISATPMAWPRLKMLAEQICAGLAAAHGAGVIHRDLKPDNVLLERSTERAVLTDFGIARGAEDPSVTQVGAIIGTPRYMAPEQLAGEELDARADLFALGVMLFELATGTRPWPGDNAIAIAVAQATSEPGTIDTSSGDIPGSFGLLVAACLQLDPADRPASAGDILAALAAGRPPMLGRDPACHPRRPSTAPQSSGAPRPAIPREPAGAVAEPTSLAVLPIACAPADEYLADGMLEDLTDTLSMTPGLRVRPAGVLRSTAAIDPRESGHRLQVDHVVTSSLRRTRAGLRIATRLINVADGFQIWAHRTDCAEVDVLEVSDQFARGIADALSTRATSVARPTDPRAVDLYLRARAELRRFWGRHAQAAAEMLEQAVEYAPTSPPILGAYAYAAVQAWAMRGDPAYLSRAEAALPPALASGHGEAYLASAQYRLNRGEPEASAADLGRALVRAPMSAQTHELAAKILREVASTQARRHYETARGLDPGRAQVIDNDLARVDALEGKWADAERRIAGLLADEDSSIQQLGILTQARLGCWRGDAEALLGPARAFMSRGTASPGTIFAIVGRIADHGRIDHAHWRSIVDVPLEPDRPQRMRIVNLQILCEIALVFDEPELALDTLGRAVAQGLMDVAWLDACPVLEHVWEHPRYPALRRQVADRAARVLAAFSSETANT